MTGPAPSWIAQKSQIHVTRRQLPPPWSDFWLWGIQSRVGESPVWDGARQRLLWIDVRGQELLRLDPGSQLLERWTLPDVVGAVAVVGDDKVILALRHQLAFFDMGSGALELLDPMAHEPFGNRLNEGKLSPAGKWFVFGSMDDRPGAKQPTGRLYKADRSGIVTALTAGLTTANGIAWSPTGAEIYFSDSYAGVIYKADWNEASGAMGARQEWAHSDEVNGRPDGALVGPGGDYLSAGVSAACLNVFNVDGLNTAKIALPLRAPTMPCVGGASASDLFITSLLRPEWSTTACLDGYLLETAVGNCWDQKFGQPQGAGR
ncbi:SMP-30/gluconolactonase/LRE family protein [Variovorax sp. HJSM1_2]|uniref:SMP-30/gluconolactonase/LRE family protein n=1 Tax=Variovorax sp. HJSM1_2 TaxID=3366263 RepID=UPI003BD5B98A